MIVELNVWIANLSEWLGAIAVAWMFSTSTRFKLPPVGFLYARRDGLVAIFLYALMLATAFIFYGANPPIFREPISGGAFIPAQAPVTDLVQSLIMAGLALIPVVVAMVVRRQPIRSTGWHQAILWPATIMGIAMAFVTLFLRNKFWVVLGGVSGPEFFALLTGLGISLAEETVFRGFILLRLVGWLGEWPGLVLTSLLYAGWHTVAWYGHLPLETVLLLAVLTFIQGMVLGWIMRKSHHIIAPAIYRTMSIWMQVLQ